MIKYICNRCDNKQAEGGETDKPMHAVVYPEKTIHLCKKCQRDFVVLGYTVSQIRSHLYENCVRERRVRSHGRLRKLYGPG